MLAKLSKIFRRVREAILQQKLFPAIAQTHLRAVSELSRKRQLPYTYAQTVDSATPTESKLEKSNIVNIVRSLLDRFSLLLLS